MISNEKTQAMKCTPTSILSLLLFLSQGFGQKARFAYLLASHENGENDSEGKEAIDRRGLF
jgi:hypothetical protein